MPVPREAQDAMILPSGTANPVVDIGHADLLDITWFDNPPVSKTAIEKGLRNRMAAVIPGDAFALKFADLFNV